ncbi:MAG: SIS domain-containing protein [Oscillatoriales cyanobacterium C42_A2020_001]|nr:SIS domain-containing protein [Leptolyngbyaceae cyanobacterium C42_A2020_001]
MNPISDRVQPPGNATSSVNPNFSSKQGFSHFMLKEIHQQPEAIQTCLTSYLGRQELEGRSQKAEDEEGGRDIQNSKFGSADSPEAKIPFGSTQGEQNSPTPQPPLANSPLPIPHRQFPIADDQLPVINQSPIFNLQSLTFPLNEIHIIASGTSRHAGLVAQFWLEQLAHIPTRIRSGSEFLEAPLPMTVHTLTVGVTQSGETADTLQALELEKQRRAVYALEYQSRLLGITNQPTSSLANLVDAVLPTLAGEEVGVAATKTFTAQLVVFYLLALELASHRQTLDRDRLTHALTALHQLPVSIHQVLQQEAAVQAVAQRLVEAQTCILLGRGINRAIALEGALKLKEATYLHAEGYAAGEFMHGPIALLDERVPVIAIAPAGATQSAILANALKARSHGSPLIGIVTANSASETAEIFDQQIVLPPIDEMLSPILTVIPLQLLAYHLAVLKGLDVDRPRNITKTLV